LALRRLIHRRLRLIMVGDGPQRASPTAGADAVFCGAQRGERWPSTMPAATCSCSRA
jgi:hypothetical protein